MQLLLANIESMEINMAYSQEQEKELYFARSVIGAINRVEFPMLIYEGEKEVVKKALNKYIDEIEEKVCFGY